MKVRPPIKLEPFTEADFDRLIGWVPSPKFLLQWAGPGFSYPLTRDQLRHHLVGETGEQPDRLIYKAVHRKHGETVGHGEIVALDRWNCSAIMARILVGPQEMRGKGIGEQIVRALLQVAFQELSLHRVALHVFTFNTSAIRCYERVGFKQEGVLREARRHGEGYWDVCVMSILEQEWPFECSPSRVSTRGSKG